MRARALLLALLTLAAGCLGGSDPADDTDGATTDGPDGERQLADLPSLFLTGSMRLTTTQPAEQTPERVPVGSFYTDWAAGEEQPTWTGPRLGSSLHLDHVQLTFFYTSQDGPVVTTGPQGEGFPEFVVYLGTEAAPMAWASVQGPDVVRSDDVVRISTGLSLPEGGLVLPEGERPVVKISPVQGQLDEADELVILANGTEAPSRASLHGRPIALAQTTAEQALDEQGMLAGSAYATGPREGTTSANHTVEVPAGALGLTADLERVQGAGVADIDLEVIGPDGRVVARSVTPEDDEGVALYAPNLEAIGTGTWSLRVVNYGNVAVEYTLTADLLGSVSAA